MSAALRMLGITLVGWAGLRAVTLGVLPGADLFSLGTSAAQTPSPQPAAIQFAPLEPAVPLGPATFTPASGPLQSAYQPVAVPYYYPLPRPVRYRPQPVSAPVYLPAPQPIYYGAAANPVEWSLASLPSARSVPPPVASVPAQTVAPTFTERRPDRLQLSSWALIRGRQGTTIAPDSLAPGGTLGGSQAGARLTYRSLHGSPHRYAPHRLSAGEAEARSRAVFAIRRSDRSPSPSPPSGARLSAAMAAVGMHSPYSSKAAFINILCGAWNWTATARPELSVHARATGSPTADSRSPARCSGNFPVGLVRGAAFSRAFTASMRDLG